MQWGLLAFLLQEKIKVREKKFVLEHILSVEELGQKLVTSFMFIVLASSCVWECLPARQVRPQAGTGRVLDVEQERIFKQVRQV